MNKLISKNDFKYYTYLKQILIDLELTNKEYYWLISDIEAYPKNKEYEELLKKDYVLLTTSELMKMLNEEDFQWIWAVFSVVPIDYTKEDILKYDLPYCASYYNQEYNPFDKEPRLQHPLAKFELYAVDSTYIFIVTEDIELIDRFKKNYLV